MKLIEPTEEMARQFVVEQGHEPDEMVPFTPPNGWAVSVRRQRWKSALIELQHTHHQLSLLLKE